MHTILKFKHCLLFAVIFFLISLGNVSAQQQKKSSNSSSEKEFFVFGPKLSVNFTQDNLFSFKTIEFVPGADLGLFFRFNIARFYIQPEVHYVIRKHNVYLILQDGAEFQSKTQTNYIGVPLLAGFKIIDLKLFKLRTFIGPEFNFALRENSKDYFQVGFQVGVGVDIWRFTVDAGYSFLAYTGWKKTQSNVFKVGVGFKCF